MHTNNKVRSLTMENRGQHRGTPGERPAPHEVTGAHAASVKVTTSVVS